MTGRVLILSWEYPPVVEGGLGRHVRKLSEELVRQGVEVHVLTRGDQAQELRAGVHVHRVCEPPFPHDLDRFLAWVRSMNHDMRRAGLALARDFDFDLVHGHDWLVARAAATLSTSLRIPFLATIHATEHGRHQGWVDKPPQSTIHATERWMARRADGLVTCSHYMRGHAADVFDVEEDAISVIPNGIDPDDLQPVGDLDALRARYARPDERLVLLVGRLVYEKGFQFALEALPAVIRRVPNLRFVVAGSGTHEQELRAQAQRLGVAEHGTFAGWIGDDMLHSLYRIADLCVVPSLYEPFGLVALEAMASGCPCIVANTGGLAEVAPSDDVALRFRSRDPSSLARMMNKVLTDDELRDRLVAQASEHVLRFDWSDVARQTREVYGRLIGAHAPVEETPTGVGTLSSEPR
ncbi:MAG: glycosyl transferase group 1 [Solirubrobacterales bacterium]|nr:glycosyl transferase group 1 [Solirubrobacterales bacterium]